MCKIDYKILFATRLGQSLKAAERIGGGRNSKVFRLETSDGKDYAAKVYYQDPNDNRNRLMTEFNALKYIKECGIENVPAPLYLDQKYGFAIYEYIYGEKIDSTRISKSDIDDAAKFLCFLKNASRSKESKLLPEASEACFSYFNILKNIKHRLERLQTVSKKGPIALGFHDFLKNELKPAFNKIYNIAKTIKGYSIDTELEMCERTLSPSDFGFHNALKMKCGKIIFLDFEYFGWDDPVKMISDFILHPGMNLNTKFKSIFANRMFNIFGTTEGFYRRIELCFPLFVIKWCTILLNEFNLTDLKRRKFAIESDDSIVMVRKNQLNKAKLMIKEVNKRNAWTATISQ